MNNYKENEKNKEIEYQLFVTHYTPNLERISNLKRRFQDIEFYNYEIITRYDRESIEHSTILAATSAREERIKRLQAISQALNLNLLNAFRNNHAINITGPELNREFRRMAFTQALFNQHEVAENSIPLNALSLAMKHLECWRVIKSRRVQHTFICEDDIIIDDHFVNKLKRLLEVVERLQFDYVDLGGGANLTPKHLYESTYSDQLLGPLYRIIPPSTRTTCMYYIAKTFVDEIFYNDYLPVLPIDYELTYLMTIHNSKCGWLESPMIIHGSEHGYYSSTLR